MIHRSTLTAIVATILISLSFYACGGDGDGQPAPETDTLKVMTFNIMCLFCGQGYDPWEDRITYMTDIFTRHQPDLVGTQEFFQAKDLNQVLELNPQYAALYYIDNGEGYLEDYPDAAIFYRSDRFDVLEEGYFWLTPTPDIPWSDGWAENQFWRIVGWAHFRQKSNGREFVFMNTHFDNNTPNQANSAPLMISRAQGWADTLPVIVSGDFNSKPDTVAYATLTTGIDGQGFHLTNSFDIADTWRVDHNQSGEVDYHPENRIDHIFFAGPGQWACDDWLVDMWVYGPNNYYPSDHWPIMTTLTF